jgi:hypothetical protein
LKRRTGRGALGKVAKSTDSIAAAGKSAKSAATPSSTAKKAHRVAGAVLPSTTATTNEIAKMSVSVPASIVRAVRVVAGRGQVSGYVAHAVERQLALDRLAGYVDDVERNLGRPISDEFMDEAATAWHGG